MLYEQTRKLFEPLTGEPLDLFECSRLFEQMRRARDRHMMSTLEAVIDHVTRINGDARAVVWAHNLHLGDARATQMG